MARDEALEFVTQFERDGFVVVDDFFDQQELNEFADALAALPAFETVGEAYDTAAQMPEFLRLVAKRETEEIVNLLLGRPMRAPLYCFTNRCRIDAPHDERRTYGWHQEVFYTIPDGRFVQTWAPLVRDTTVFNGTIEVCPGSHKEGIARQAWQPEVPGRASQIIVDPAEVAKYTPRALPMELGQMLFFDSRLLHRSGRNESLDTRYSLVGMYHDVDAPGFRAPVPGFNWRGKTPRQWFDECGERAC